MRSSTLLVAALSSAAVARPFDDPPPKFETSEAGNPFIDGRYADPDNEFYNGEHWVFPTSSRPYEEQTYLDAFSSPDLVHWTKHANVLQSSDFEWAHLAMWAPAPIERNGKYYLYFAANDIQEDHGDYVGGIGVGVADKPEGPYKDAIGAPLIGQYHNGAQPIDQDVFIDDDGQAYIYYGGHSHCNVAKLNEDMISIGKFDDGDVYKEITPKNFVEGSQMMKRDGKYYFFWSEGGWTGPDYAVSYAISDSPIGPFERVDKILEQDAAVATGSGHNGVIRIPNTDIYYIVYHRHPLGATQGEDRHTCYDRLYFNEDGSIKPITMLVHDNFDDNNMYGWKVIDGDWEAKNERLNGGSSDGGKTMLNTNFGDFTYEVDINFPQAGTGDAGLVFRASNAGPGTDAYQGYYAGIDLEGFVFLGRADNNWTLLARKCGKVKPGRDYHLKVVGRGDNISVFVNDMDKPKISKNDSTFNSGANGLRVFQTDASFDNLKLGHL